MAIKLIESMSVDWDPARYRDEHQEKLMGWIQQKIDEGHFEAAAEHEDDETVPDSNVVDLVDYLKRSVAKRSGDSGSREDETEGSGNSQSGSKRSSSAKAKKSGKKTTSKKASRETATKKKATTKKKKAETQKKARKAS